jgi:hypothetical protein
MAYETAFASPPGEKVRMLAFAGARDWFDWSGWSFTVGGTLLSLSGLYFTFREARAARRRAAEARTAADAAHTASLAAVRAVSSRTTASDLISIRKDLEAILRALEARNVVNALVAVRVSREALTRMRERLESGENRSEIGRVLKDVRWLQETLERAMHESAPLPRFAEVSALLSEHMDTLAGWNEQLQFERVEAL